MENKEASDQQDVCISYVVSLQYIGGRRGGYFGPQPWCKADWATSARRVAALLWAGIIDLSALMFDIRAGAAVVLIGRRYVPTRCCWWGHRTRFFSSWDPELTQDLST